jgi:hypothetical protein
MISNSGVWVTPTTGLIPTPKDIAVHAGRITRYAGAIWSPLLAHLVFVGELTWAHMMLSGKPFDYPTWAWSLLHDVHETFMGEIPRRWKIAERKNQEKEVDRGILAAFRLAHQHIDHQLIKAMDEHALMAEAVVLGLPGFREKYCAENKLDAFPTPPDAELDMMRSLVDSDFYRAPACLSPDTRAVAGFAQVLNTIQKGELHMALVIFRNLLNHELPPFDGFDRSAGRG